MNWSKLRNKLLKMKIRKIKEVDNLQDKLNPIYDYSETEKQILVSGSRSEALGARDFPIPTGICSEPTSEELIELNKYDRVGHLLKNPINHCIFYCKSNGYCFFGGLCDKKQKISNARVAAYKESMQLEILKMKEEQNK